MSLTVERLAPADAGGAAAWDAFVMACPQATFFHRAGWQRILRDVFRHDTHFLLVRTEGRITGVLPLAHVKSFLFGNALTSLPFAVYGGVAALDDASAQALEAEAQRLAKSLGVQHLELRHVEQRHADWPVQDLYVTFRKVILPDEEANMLAIPRKQRAMVRKGIKNGLKSEIDTHAGRFFALFADNVHRHGTPAMPKRWFQALRDEFGDDCEVLTVVSPDGKPFAPAEALEGDRKVWTFTREHLAATEPDVQGPPLWAVLPNTAVRLEEWKERGETKNAFATPEKLSSWLSEQYTAQAQVSPELVTTVKEVLAGVPDEPEAKARALYEHVCRTIQYCAIEIGYGGWIPHTSPAVQKLRYGDCKDKATYLHALLKVANVS